MAKAQLQELKKEATEAMEIQKKRYVTNTWTFLILYSSPAHFSILIYDIWSLSS